MKALDKLRANGVALCVGAVLALAGLAAHAAEPKKTLNIAFRSAESSLDPVKMSDLYSRTISPHIFEALYQYDHLARPFKARPLIAECMPAASADFRTWTIRVKPGIYFQSDTAFKGPNGQQVRREVTAEDFVYPFKRVADPALKSPQWSWIDSYKILGLAELRKAALDAKKPFDYDTPVEGVRALDRYTLQIKVAEPRPRLLYGLLIGSDLLGAVAREVVEFYGDKIDEHPVGTGPFRLKQWRRASLIVLERNPEYRERFYDAEPQANDAEGQALLARFKGRKLPMIDEVRVAIVPEEQPFWLSFLNQEIDILATSASPLPGTFITQAMPNGKLAPNLAKRGIQAVRQVNSDVGFVMFNMEDPVVGGYTQEKIALRRAIGLAYDNEREIRVVRKGQAVPAQSNVVPHTTGYDPAYKSEMSAYDPARAKALLDMFGFVDRNGDGYRELPDGQPLLIVRSTQPEQINRELDTLWQKSLQAVGIQTRFQIQSFAENLKAGRAGKFQVWSLAGSAADPDGQGSLQRFDSTQAGGQNMARFKNARFDEVYKQLSALPDGPEREALFLEAKKIAAVYMPYRSLSHRISTDIWHPWVVGYRRPLFWQEWWHMVDIDESRRAQR